MIYLKRTFPITILVLITMAIAACGNSTSSGSGSTPTPPAPTATTPAPVATTPTTAAAVVMTATATVKGQSVTILTDASGKTLYYFTPDTATTSACTSTCAQTWPPLLATGSGTPTSASSLPGTLSVVSSGNGNQVAYNGHLLYTFSGDTSPGQTNGEGLFGKWFVATTNLAVGNGSSSGALIKTATATVQGKSVTILTDASGKTLYYFTPDTAAASSCTGSCAQTWPPLLATSATPTSATTLPGKLTVVSSGNGNQVEYNGHLLYTFSGDTAPGQTNGEGLFGKWFVATTDLQ